MAKGGTGRAGRIHDVPQPGTRTLDPKYELTPAERATLARRMAELEAGGVHWVQANGLAWREIWAARGVVE